MRSFAPRKQAGYMTASDQICLQRRVNFLAFRGPSIHESMAGNHHGGLPDVEHAAVNFLRGF